MFKGFMVSYNNYWNTDEDLFFVETLTEIQRRGCKR
jgi:hypothetical protein